MDRPVYQPPEARRGAAPSPDVQASMRELRMSELQRRKDEAAAALGRLDPNDPASAQRVRELTKALRGASDEMHRLKTRPVQGEGEQSLKDLKGIEAGRKQEEAGWEEREWQARIRVAKAGSKDEGERSVA